MSAMTAEQRWTCPACSQAATTAFCPTCGERSIHTRVLTLRGLLGQLANVLTNIDGRLLRTLRQLVTRPGALTEAYVNGNRKQFLGPFQLFVLVNALFFAIQSGTRTNIFSSPLDSHLHHQDWSSIAQPLVAHRLQQKQMSIEAYQPVFDRIVVRNAKALIVLMTLPFAGLVSLAYYRSRRPFGVHALFSLHLYSFLLLLFCTSVLIAMIDVLLGGEGLNSARVDNVLTFLNLTACAVYLYFAIGRVYGARGGSRAFTAIALSMAVAVIVLGYRLLVFLITLYTT